MTKSLFVFIIICVFVGLSCAQDLLFDNSGDYASCTQSGCYNYNTGAFGGPETNHIKVVPSFSVPTGEKWLVTSVRWPFYSSSTPSPVGVTIFNDSDTSPGPSLVSVLISNPTITEIPQEGIELSSYTFGTAVTITEGLYWVQVLKPNTVSGDPVLLPVCKSESANAEIYCGTTVTPTPDCNAQQSNCILDDFEYTNGVPHVSLVSKVPFSILGYKYGACCEEPTPGIFTCNESTSNDCIDFRGSFPDTVCSVNLCDPPASSSSQTSSSTPSSESGSSGSPSDSNNSSSESKSQDGGDADGTDGTDGTDGADGADATNSDNADGGNSGSAYVQNFLCYF